MSNLPCELLDHIFDLLHDSQPFGQIPLDLRNCCLVSKSWIPRTRRHLFAEIHFQTAKSLRLWKKTFRNRSTSAARYTKCLIIGGPKVLTAADAKASSWLKGFSRVVRLKLVEQDPFCSGWWIACVVFRGFSPVIKSLHVDFTPLIVYPASELFNLILSFPLLEDLSVAKSYYAWVGSSSDSDEPLALVQPSSLYTFTGTLDLSLRGGTESFIRWLLSLPDCIHFRKFILEWVCNEDISLTVELMERYSHVLKSLDIAAHSSYGTSIGDPIHPHGSNLLLFPADPRSVSFNLSKATKLADVVFRPRMMRVEWISPALRVVTLEHRDLRRMCVDVPYYFPSDGDVRKVIGEGFCEDWLDLDRTLIHLWESFSIRPNVR